MRETARGLIRGRCCSKEVLLLHHRRFGVRRRLVRGKRFEVPGSLPSTRVASEAECLVVLVARSVQVLSVPSARCQW